MELLTAKTANIGFSTSQVFMGNGCLFIGDTTGAYKWFSQAVLQHHPMAIYQLAWMNLHGVGCEQNIRAARDGFQSLTELGSSHNLEIAYFPLYTCYQKLGDKMNADDILQRGFRNNSSECTRVLACREYKYGDKEKAYTLLKKASDLGDLYSSYHVAIFPGKEKNIPLLRNSSQGFWKSAELMGALIMRKEIIGDWKDALDYYRKAYILIPDDQPAKNWLERIIWWMENSFGKGEFGLDFLIFSEPSNNHPIDNARRCIDERKFKESANYFDECLKNREYIGESSFNLGFLCLAGLGGEKNLHKAHEYFSIAMEHFCRDADDNLRIVGIIQGIREVMEQDPLNWEALVQVYQTESNFLKVFQLKNKMSKMNS